MEVVATGFRVSLMDHMRGTTDVQELADPMQVRIWPGSFDFVSR